MKTVIYIVGAFILGGLITTTLYLQFAVENDFGTKANMSPGVKGNQSQSEPLYWVAPMDPNFRRDKPGKSPMGMALIPFYDEKSDDNDMSAQAGAVKVSPNVINNLGVRTARVRLATLNNTIHTVGYIGYNEDTIVHMHPRVEGWVDALYVSTAGEAVTKGQKVYGIYSPQLVSAQEEYLLAKKRDNRVLIDAARQRLHSLHMPDKAMEELQNSNKVLQSVTFYAPQSGVLEHLKIRHGFYVKPGDTLMSIASLDEVWVEAEVFEQQAALLEVGLPVTMNVAYLPEQQWHGELDYIYPSLDKTTRALRVRLRFENLQRQLKPNMFADIRIDGKASEPTLLVPREAVIRTGRQDRLVLALGKGYFKSVEVKLGRMNSDFIEIVQGLEAGDEIVTSAQFLLDSQSSISSDFIRMDHDNAASALSEKSETIIGDMESMNGMNQNESMSNMKHDAQNMAHSVTQQATVKGTVNKIDYASGLVNISRGPIKKWGRGPDTMDFIFSDQLSPAVIKTLLPKSEMTFTFEIKDGEFIVTSFTLMTKDTQ
ncbi:efflux RND transporter periplasmic adaptor subunit [Paraglaciecola polaris]|uniref:Cu(I)/Ag(I) efflux system membrane protein CusB n=1 Tax=Paraglaciecola polaris LMG 21857 TaxID=1129793 RepID=K6ZV57_9ALTE|nr:efflux RND transporter periplasmic adaptor subunit [Paraglaciecola polaris]GAC32678.1 Cu(I)/Ag(I) efflux system membrane protein CusB [Paraglaciecola polaris LMG 21857]